VSSVITIGFSGRTRACIRSEFSAPIADNERRETLIHVALLTARTFAALDPETQLTFAATLREWIEDQFVACPTRLIPGDPMACLPRFASTFVAPVREYALASKGCNHNGRGVAFFLPMALVSFLHHVVVTHSNPEELLKPAVALCAAVVIQPMTMENHFQAAAASLPKVAPLMQKAPQEKELEAEEIVRRPSVAPQPSAQLPLAQQPIREVIRQELAVVRRRERRRVLVLSASLAALLIIAGVQYLSVHEPQRPPPREVVSLPAPIPVPSQKPTPAPPPESQPELPKASGPGMTSPSQQESPPFSVSEQTARPPGVVETPSAPSLVPPPAPPPPAASPPPAPSPPAASVPPPGPSPVIEEGALKSSSYAIRVYQQEVRELTDDAVAQVIVVVNAIEGQVLTEFELKDVLAYGLQQTRADLKRIQRLRPPAMYRERHRDILQAVMELELLGRELRLARMQPPEGLLRERLARIQGSLEEALLAIEKF
jgi:hypothetical protein